MPDSYEKMMAMTEINTAIRDHLRGEADADMEDIDLLSKLGKMIQEKNTQLSSRGEEISLEAVAESLVDFQNAKLGDSLTDDILELNSLRMPVLVEKLRRNIPRA